MTPPTVDEDRPERVWGVATVPPVRSEQVEAPVDRPEPLTGVFTAISVGPKPEPAEPPRTRRARHGQPERPTRRWTARLRTFIVVLILVGAAGAGGYHIVRQRLAAQAFVDLGSVILTAEAVPVGFAEAVVVDSIAVAQHANVAAGQDLARVTTAVGKPEVLKAPAAGTVAAVKVSVGGVAKGGEAIIMLYDQAKLTFTADVSVTELRRLRLGMTAYIDGPGLAGRVAATLDHVVPIVGSNASSTTDKLTVVLVPTEPDRATVGTLVPGLPFHAVVDTNTAQGATSAVNTT